MKPDFPAFFTPPHLLSDLPPQTPVLIGYSGGADSGALLHCLFLYAKRYDTPLTVMHIHHGIRGEEADRDLAFCRETAARYGLPFLAVYRDVPGLRQPDESLETAARRVRYDAFTDTMLSRTIPLLATAHHADDNLETVLFHLARGSGLDGLCGIPPARAMAGGTVIRPLLRASKEELEAYCDAVGLSHLVDSTNGDATYSRNRLRTQVVPVLRTLFPHPEQTVYRQSEALREDADALNALADELIRGRSSIPLDELSHVHPAVAGRALVRLVRTAAGEDTAPALSYSLRTSLLAFAKRGGEHTRFSLPEGLETVCENGAICVRKTKAEAAEKALPGYVIPLRDGLAISDAAGVAVTVGENGKVFSGLCKNIYNLSINAHAKSDTIVRSLFIRTRQPGDKIQMGGMHKKVKKLLCDAHMPPNERDRLPLLCDEEGILWIPGIGLRDGCLPIGYDPAAVLTFWMTDKIPGGD